MTPEKIADFKRRLKEEKALVEKQLGELGHKDETTGEWTATSGEIDAASTEPDELADRMETQEENAEEMAGLRPRLSDITDALKKIGTGSYGICEVCNEAIEEERLDANPAARTCMKHM